MVHETELNCSRKGREGERGKFHLLNPFFLANPTQAKFICESKLCVLYFPLFPPPPPPPSECSGGWSFPCASVLTSWLLRQKKIMDTDFIHVHCMPWPLLAFFLHLVPRQSCITLVLVRPSSISVELLGQKGLQDRMVRISSPLPPPSILHAKQRGSRVSRPT